MRVLIVASKKRLLGYAALLFCFAVLFSAIVSHKQEILPVFDFSGEKYIAIIIDDFGYDGEGTQQLLEMDLPLTAAVMPGMETSTRDAINFYEKGCDVILHMPMEGHRIKQSWLGPFALTADLGPDSIRENIRLGMESVPHAVGLNNHMGSKVMEQEAVISVVMAVMQEQQLLFVDSKTTAKSVAEKVAGATGVPYFERDIFLDGDDIKDVATATKRLQQTAQVADKRGYAIAIGHVGTAGGNSTVQALAALVPELEQQGYRFVTLTQLKELIEESQMMSGEL